MKSPQIDWDAIRHDLDEFGVATTGQILSAQECRALRALYDGKGHFRSHIIMQRHGFGAGEYKYFAEPLPRQIAELRSAFYGHLAPLGNIWNRRMGLDRQYPETLEAS